MSNIRMRTFSSVELGTSRNNKNPILSPALGILYVSTLRVNLRVVMSDECLYVLVETVIWREFGSVGVAVAHLEVLYRG